MLDFEESSTRSIRILAKDQNDASAEQQFSISILDLDDEKPVIALNGDKQVTHEAGSIYVDANASWSDNVDGSGIVVGVRDVNSSILGIYTIVYNFTDQAGNQVQVSRTVTVVDTTGPVITVNWRCQCYGMMRVGEYIDLGNFG